METPLETLQELCAAAAARHAVEGAALPAASFEDAAVAAAAAKGRTKDLPPAPRGDEAVRGDEAALLRRLAEHHAATAAAPPVAVAPPPPMATAAAVAVTLRPETHAECAAALEEILRQYRAP